MAKSIPINIWDTSCYCIRNITHWGVSSTKPCLSRRWLLATIAAVATAIWTTLGRTPDPERDLPSIVIEFVSGSLRDRVCDYQEKLSEYLAIGVSEYWIIDRFQRFMAVYKKGESGAIQQVIAETESYATELLPGFILPLARLFGLADVWRKASKKRVHKPKPPGPTE